MDIELNFVDCHPMHRLPNYNILIIYILTLPSLFMIEMLHRRGKKIMKTWSTFIPGATKHTSYRVTKQETLFQ